MHKTHTHRGNQFLIKVGTAQGLCTPKNEACSSANNNTGTHNRQTMKNLYNPRRQAKPQTTNHRNTLSTMLRAQLPAPAAVRGVQPLVQQAKQPWHRAAAATPASPARDRGHQRRKRKVSSPPKIAISPKNDDRQRICRFYNISSMDID